MYIVYGGKVLIIKLVALNKNYRKLKVLGFENRHKTIYSPSDCLKTPKRKITLKIC